MDRKLIDYLPDIVKELSEFKQVMQTEQTQTEILWTAIDDLLKEAFVQEESKTGISKWESILYITPKDTDSLPIRRFRITGRLNEDLPFTYRTLERQLTALCGENGYSITLNNDEYTLLIRVALTSKKLKEEVGTLAERIVPLNLLLDVDLMYNTHRMLKPYTHQHLSQYTHSSLREDPFEE